MANLNVMVREHFGKIVFLHQIVPGSADRSYGIHVAQLAGVPKTVSQRAEEILAELEASGHRVDEPHAETPTPHVAPKASQNGTLQLTLFETAEHPLVKEIRELDVDAMTPLEALQRLSEWRKDL